MGVYIRVDQQWWQPWANTIAYWKLDGDALDYSWNSRDLTASGITYESGWPWQVWVFSWWATAYYQDNTLFNISYPFTYSLYVQTAQVPSGTYDGTNPYYTMAIVTQNWTNDNIFDKVSGFAEDGFLWFNYYNDWYYCMWWTAQSNTRYYLVYTFDGVKQRIYSNWTLVWENPCGWSYTGFSNARLVLASQRARNETIAFNWKMSNVIIENKVRTAQEISDYYNQTKSLYGIA